MGCNSGHNRQQGRGDGHSAPGQGGLHWQGSHCEGHHPGAREHPIRAARSTSRREDRFHFGWRLETGIRSTGNTTFIHNTCMCMYESMYLCIYVCM